MNIAWFIVITLVIVIIHVYVSSRYSLSRISYVRSFSEHAVFEGEDIEMTDELSNRKVLPVPWVRLESSMGKHLIFKHQSNRDSDMNHEGHHRTLFSLMPYQKFKRKRAVTCSKRGLYQFKTVALSAGDVFGFTESFKDVSSTAEIVVYPRLLDMKDIPLPIYNWLGDITVRRWMIEDPFLIAGVREYAYGDPINMVNWKATARTSHLQVNQNEYTADHELMIYVNFNQTDDIWLPVRDEVLMEKAISYAATIVEYAISEGIRTGFGCNAYFVGTSKNESIRIEPENSKQQLMYLLETMAKLAVDSKKSMNSFLKEDIEMGREGNDILLITAIKTDEMQEHIQMLEELGNTVEVLMLEKTTADIVQPG